MFVFEICDLYVMVEIEVGIILIFNGINFIMNMGEIYVIMGFNGFGKLILVYMIVGYFKYIVMFGFIMFDG